MTRLPDSVWLWTPDSLDKNDEDMDKVIAGNQVLNKLYSQILSGRLSKDTLEEMGDVFSALGLNPDTYAENTAFYLGI